MGRRCRFALIREKITLKFYAKSNRTGDSQSKKWKKEEGKAFDGSLCNLSLERVLSLGWEVSRCQQVKKFCLQGFGPGLPEFRRFCRRAGVPRRVLRAEA
jgi:hypothetical protein